MGSTLVELADKLGILEKIKDKLFEDPTVEYKELSKTLVGFINSYESVDNLITDILSISISAMKKEEDAQKIRELLLSAAGGALGPRTHPVRALCNNLRLL